MDRTQLTPELAEAMRHEDSKPLTAAQQAEADRQLAEIRVAMRERQLEAKAAETGPNTPPLHDPPLIRTVVRKGIGYMLTRET